MFINYFHYINVTTQGKFLRQKVGLPKQKAAECH